MLTAVELPGRLAELVSIATDGRIDADAALDAPSLALLGLDSLGSLRLIDTVEAEFGVPLDLDQDPNILDSVRSLARYLLDTASTSE